MSSRTWVRLVLLAGLLVVLGFVLPGWSQGAKGKKYALLVGVKEYNHNKLPDLKYTENDVTELAGLLRPAGYEVTLLTQAQGRKDPRRKPTAANIRAALKKLLAEKGKRDTILVALGGGTGCCSRSRGRTRVSSARLTPSSMTRGSSSVSEGCSRTSTPAGRANISR
jgi:hypothetical protein